MENALKQERLTQWRQSLNLFGSDFFDLVWVGKVVQENDEDLEDNSLDGIYESWKQFSVSEHNIEYIDVDEDTIAAFMFYHFGTEADELDMPASITDETEFEITEEGYLEFN